MAAQQSDPMPVPQRLNGQYVTAAVRLAPWPDRANRYAAVCLENNSGRYLFHPGAFYGRDGRYHAGQPRDVDDLAHALLLLFDAARPMWEVGIAEGEAA